MGQVEAQSHGWHVSLVLLGQHGAAVMCRLFTEQVGGASFKFLGNWSPILAQSGKSHALFKNTEIQLSV